MQENETNFGRNQLRTISMSELYENIYPGKTPIIDGMLYGGTYLFVGAPKIGKSFMMAQIAYHVSTGAPLWGFPVRRGTVLYAELEYTPENVNGFAKGIYCDWMLKSNDQQELPDYMPGHDVEVIATWKSENYILDANGGMFYLEEWSEETEDVILKTCTRAELSFDYDYYPDEIMAFRDGKAFKGWYYDLNCTKPYDYEKQG